MFDKETLLSVYRVLNLPSEIMNFDAKDYILLRCGHDCTIKWLALDKFIEPYENEFLAYLIVSDNKNPKNAYYYETAVDLTGKRWRRITPVLEDGTPDKSREISFNDAA